MGEGTGTGRRGWAGAVVAAALAGTVAAGGPPAAAGGHGPRTERVNTAPDGSEAVGGGSFNAAISPDGRRLLLHSCGVEYGLYLKDLGTDEDTLVSPGTDGRPRMGTAGPDAMTPDGREVVFEPYLDDLVTGDTNHETDVFLRHVR
ncbi:hypothetical protein ACH4FX_37625 [Streptomyces sp. NPDC018019]|uniref:hypothetical protein n=1 Tax=Streptomyces sp. NPDC018019 TaxID=3365030 RepID=UPI003789565A